MRQYALTPHFLSSHFAQFVQPFFEVKGSNISQSKSLLILKAEYMYSAVFFCRNAWNSAIHLFKIWFSDILTNLLSKKKKKKKKCLHTFFLNFKHQNNICEQCYVLLSLDKHQTTTCTNLFSAFIIYRWFIELRLKTPQMVKNTRWACACAKVFTLSYHHSETVWIMWH